MGPLTLSGGPNVTIRGDPGNSDRREGHYGGIASILHPEPDGRRASARALGAFLALALVLVTALAGCSSDDGGKAAGKPLPDVALTDLATGRDASWPASGTPTVVNFWASWCGPCRKEMPAFQQVADRLGKKVTIIGVTDETDHDASRKAARTSGASYPLLVDDDQELLIDLGLASLPATVFVDADGKVVGRHTGALTESELLAQIKDRYGITP